MTLKNAPCDARALLDRSPFTAVERAVAELRRGQPVLVYEGAGCALVCAAETLAFPHGLRDEFPGDLWRDLGQPCLLLTARRASVLGLTVEELHQSAVFAVDLSDVSCDQVSALFDPLYDSVRELSDDSGVFVRAHCSQGLAASAVDLVKLARLLPSAFFAELPAGFADARAAFAKRHDLLCVPVSEVMDYRRACAVALKPVTTASIPLDVAEQVAVTAFRPADGGLEHLAMQVGDCPPDQPVLVRLHSECFTGDLLGSLRCDCGDQLRGALAIMAEAGGGILLYLSQEGRGIGLMNKLRAYALQDRGADTLEANEMIGFDPDERLYRPAATMLRHLGFESVRLMTNNLDKVVELERCGIRVVDRVEHAFPANGHNEFYLKTKATRFGHLMHAPLEKKK